jgi:hypothetical protein
MAFQIARLFRAPLEEVFTYPEDSGSGS